MGNKAKCHATAPLRSFRYPLKNLIPSSFIKAKVFIVELCTWMARGGKGKVEDGRAILSCFTDVDFKFPPGNSLGARAERYKSKHRDTQGEN